MDQMQIKQMLQESEFFSDIPDEILDQIIAKAKWFKVAKDDLLIREQSPPTHIYLITNGIFSVSKKVETGEDGTKATFVMLSKGEMVGVFSFLDDEPRSADVVAMTDNCSVIQISIQELMKLAPRSFYIKLARKLSSNIRASNEKIVKNLVNELEHNKKLLNIGRFITYLLLLISFYNLALKGFASLSQNPYTSMFASTSVIFIFTIVLSIMARTMRYPLTKFGVNLNNVGKALTESFLYSILFIIAATFCKWVIIHTVPIFRDTSLIELHKVILLSPDLFIFYVSVIVYSIFILLQEFIARGILLGSLLEFFGGRKPLVANVVTSGVFAAMHVHLSSLFALIVFIPSLLWGWLFIRHRTLLSPILSHWLIGSWAIFILGIQNWT